MLKIASQSSALSAGKSDGDFQRADTTMLEEASDEFFYLRKLLKCLSPQVVNSFEL